MVMKEKAASAWLRLFSFLGPPIPARLFTCLTREAWTILFSNNMWSTLKIAKPEPSPNDKMLLVSQSEVSTVLAFNSAKQLQFTPRESFEIFFWQNSD